LKSNQVGSELLVSFNDVLAGIVEQLAFFSKLDRSFFAVDQLALVGQFELGKLLRDGGLAQEIFVGCF
jgi:hypothetical protein